MKMKSCSCSSSLLVISKKNHHTSHAVLMCHPIVKANHNNRSTRCNTFPERTETWILIIEYRKVSNDRLTFAFKIYSIEINVLNKTYQSQKSIKVQDHAKNRLTFAFKVASNSYFINEYLNVRRKESRESEKICCT